MFEGVIASILNKYLGQFLLGFKSNDIQIGADIEFRNVGLRRDALAALGLPVEIRRGSVGHLHVQIPWTSLFSKAVVVTLSDIFLVATTAADIAAVEDPEAEFKAKMEAVEAFEQRREEAEKTDTKGPGFAERLAMKIVDNMQIIIKRIHVRFEENEKLQEGHPVAVGVCIESARAETTDANWKPAYTKEGDLKENPMLFKLGEVRGLSIFMDQLPIPDLQVPKSQVAVEDMTAKEFVDFMSGQISTATHPVQHDFILAPLSADLKVFIDLNFMITDMV